MPGQLVSTQCCDSVGTRLPAWSHICDSAWLRAAAEYSGLTL